MRSRAVALLIVGAALAPGAAVAAAPAPLPSRYSAGQVSCQIHVGCSTIPPRAGYITRYRWAEGDSAVVLIEASAGSLARIKVFVSSTRRVRVSWRTSCQAPPSYQPTVNTGEFSAKGRVRHSITGASTGSCRVRLDTTGRRGLYVEIDGYPRPLVYPPGFAP